MPDAIEVRKVPIHSVADASLPRFQVRSTSKPPRARRPLTRPSGQAGGSAGSSRMQPLPSWLCSNASAQQRNS